MNFIVEDLQNIFHKTFREHYRTQLVFGADEPFYEAAKSDTEEHKIICREDFFASGLHEISHWCVAGEKRRMIDDFGYWYNPDGRSIEQQKVFESVEITPQALEMAFSKACNYNFKVSADNLSLPEYDTAPFTKKVTQKFQYYEKNGYPKRAELFIKALKEFYSNQVQ